MNATRALVEKLASTITTPSTISISTERESSDMCLKVINSEYMKLLISHGDFEGWNAQKSSKRR
jgi:hypothetical protein